MRRKRIVTRPTRFGAWAGLFVNIGMLAVGIKMFETLSEDRGFGQPGGEIGSFFLLFWLAIVAAMVLFNLKVILTGKTPPTTVYEIEEENDNHPKPEEPRNLKESPAALLRQLESLREEKLITEAEYQEKRRSILNRLG